MSTMVVELYDALRKAGVEESLARNAAAAVLSAGKAEELVTKTDLRAEMETLRRELADTRTELIKWNVGAMLALTAIYTAINRFMFGG